MTRVLVTGGSMGIGLAIAQALAERGHQVALVARGSEALEEAYGLLPGEGHAWHALDVSDENAWREIRYERLAGLVCAAAVVGPVGPVDTYAPGEFRRTFEINVCGTLFAIQHNLSALRRGDGSIVTFSGGGGTAPLPRYDAYAASKAAIVRLTENLAPVLDPLVINCVAPGFVATRMHDSTLAAGPDAAGQEYYERTIRDLDRGGIPPAESAELVCMLLSGIPFSGKLISAQWDPWRDPRFHERLASDRHLGTLRRVDGMLFSEVET